MFQNNQIKIEKIIHYSSHYVYIKIILDNMIKNLFLLLSFLACCIVNTQMCNNNMIINTHINEYTPLGSTNGKYTLHSSCIITNLNSRKTTIQIENPNTLCSYDTDNRSFETKILDYLTPEFIIAINNTYKKFDSAKFYDIVIEIIGSKYAFPFLIVVSRRFILISIETYYQIKKSRSTNSSLKSNVCTYN
jgi:hypothetical protein